MSLLPGLIEILKEPLKIFSKNRKIRTFITFNTARTTAFIAIFIILTKPLIIDILIEKNILRYATTNTPKFTKIITFIQQDIGIFFGLEFVFLILILISSLLSAPTTILAAAIIHAGKQELTLKDLLSRIGRISRRPTVTLLYTYLLSQIYLLIYAAILIGIMQITETLIILAILTLFISISGFIYFLYLSVNWNLAVVVSVVEDIKGIEAVKKAEQISKGMKLQGVLMIVLLSMLNLGFALGMNMIRLVLWSIDWDSFGLAFVLVISFVEIFSLALLSMYWYAAFTVFYFRCKQSFGEKVEIFEERFDGYSQIPTDLTAPIVDHNIP